PDDRHATFVDEFGECIDDRLDRSLRQALRAAIHDLDRPIDHPRRVAVTEHQLQGLRVVTPVAGARADVVDQEADLDRLRVTRSRHEFSSRLTSWSCSAPTSFARSPMRSSVRHALRAEEW